MPAPWKTVYDASVAPWAQWRSVIDSAASHARRRAAASVDYERLLADGPGQWRRVIADTPLATVDAHLAVKEPEFVMAATVATAQRAVEVLLAEPGDPLIMAAAASRLVESSVHTFCDPRTGRTYRHLAGAKNAGAFFTPPDVAIRMALSALVDRSEVYRALEPAAGTGMLSAALLLAARSSGCRVRRVEVWELSPYVARMCDAVLAAVKDQLDFECEVTVLQADALDKFALDKPCAEGDDDDKRFDVILLNPPYGRLKFLRSALTNAETKAKRIVSAEREARNRIEAAQAKVKTLAADLGLGRGTPDYQRLFIAGAYQSLSSSGRLVVIAPSAWTSGRDASDLRAMLMEPRSLVGLALYPEDCQLFPTVNQPTAVAVVDKAGGAAAFDVAEIDSRTRLPRGSYRINYDELSLAGSNPWRIPLVSPKLWDAYRHLAAVPKLGDSPDVKNVRGELDLTLDARLVTRRATGIRLIRGDHVERYVLRDARHSERSGYVTAGGAAEMLSRPKGTDGTRPRVVGRQCSYMGKGRRLSFAVIPANVVVANSCNYLVTDDADDVYAAAVVLNSVVAEWWFRVHSSNNHVSNYEIDDKPWPMRDTEANAAHRIIGRQLHSAYGSLEFGVSKIGSALEDVADALVCHGLKLPPEMARLIVEEIEPTRAPRVANMVAWLERNGLPGVLTQSAAWLHHAAPTLSELDRQMLAHVPQGGNWQSIPESVPSARLQQIRAMTAERGVVRTTYYGRLRPDQPAYTIATYYNRPGNGTNIHPHEDRTLTSREAARLQSFPDSYVFLGNDGAVRKQIGNAVPPLLGYAVGRQLLQAGCTAPIVDLFAGAGGLSLGLEMAGCAIAAAVDNDKSCEQTYTFNRACESAADPDSPRTVFVSADLAGPAGRVTALEVIRRKLGSRRVGAVVGGPPCQGYSHAGFRDPRDERNDLAVVFLDFVRWLEPEIVVLENVDGLLTYRKGAVIAELRQSLVELGYSVAEPWLLAAECYGVPQMRRRVFVVASRNARVEYPAPVLARCLGRREVAGDPSLLPYPVTVAEAFRGVPALGVTSHASVGGRKVRGAYHRWSSGFITADQLLSELTQ